MADIYQLVLEADGFVTKAEPALEPEKEEDE